MSQDIISLLRPKLREYLESQSVHVSANGFFCCVHPNHPDRNPSSSLGGGLNEEVYRCFSCQTAGNVFNAAHWLEKLPLDGPEFWDTTIAKLAKQFDVPYNPMEISEDKRREYQTYRAYQDAVTVILNLTYEKGVIRENHIGIKHLLDRGITPETISSWNIGVITSFKDYKEGLLALGWDEKYLMSKDLLRSDLFNKDSFIIPIFNHRGRPVGFVTRNVKADRVGPKYINSVNTDIYRKGEILFGYSSAKKHNGPLYIVEGYLDAIYLQQAGIDKVVALGSTVVTDEHIEQTLFNDQTDIIVCLDADNGGRAGVRLAIERMAHLSRFNLKIKDLPEGMDPDDFVADNGVDAFYAQENYSPFKWSLKHSDYTQDLATLAQQMVGTIAAERSSILRLKMIKELSTFTSISEIEIKKDVDMLVNRDDDKYLKEIHDVNQFVQMQLSRKKVSDTKPILKDALSKLEVIDEKHNATKDLRIDFFDNLSRLDEKIKNGDYKYGLICPNFKNLEKQMDGIPYWNNLMLLAGRPSCGKSAIINSLSLDIIEHNPDSAVFIMSIDDNSDALVQKLIAIRTGMSTSKIKQYASLNSAQKDAYHAAMDWVKSVSDRLIIADATAGNSIDTFDNHVNWFVKNYQSAKKVFALDNFHKLSIRSSSDKRMDALTEASSRIKTVGQQNDLSIICSVELRKLITENARPTRQDMQGTNKLDYDADVIGLVHNDFNVNPSTRLVTTKQVDGELVTMPYIELQIAKNKINGNTGLNVYNFNTVSMQFTEANKAQFVQLMKSNKSDVIKC